MSLWFRILRAWLPAALVLTVACGVGYVTVQQVYRMSANDPQIQMARDAATRLLHGDSSSEVVPLDKIDVAQSLAPFTIVYDVSDVPRAWSGELDGKPPVPPTGVLNAARDKGENIITWAPKPDVRIAAVVVAADAPRQRVVLVGRSLSEVEKRIDDLGKIVLLGWAVGIVALFVLIAGLEWFGRRLKRAKHEDVASA